MTRVSRREDGRADGRDARSTGEDGRAVGGEGVSASLRGSGSAATFLGRLTGRGALALRLGLAIVSKSRTGNLFGQGLGSSSMIVRQSRAKPKRPDAGIGSGWGVLLGCGQAGWSWRRIRGISNDPPGAGRPGAGRRWMWRAGCYCNGSGRTNLILLRSRAIPIEA